MVLTHMLREVRAGHPGAVPRHVPPLRADARLIATRLTRAVGAEPDHPAGEGAEASACGRPRAPTACCQRHKVEPLFEALARLRHLVHRRCVASSRASRANLQENEPFKLPSEDHPPRLADRRRGPRATCGSTRRTTTSRCCRSTNVGYTSIGCEPCTTPPLDPDNPRSGRWQGQKLECGIHIQAK